MFESIWKKILRRRGMSLLAIPALFLWIASLFYRIGLAIIKATRGKAVKVEIPVISIGNLSVGGTGKTPIIATLAEFLLEEGVKVGIVSSAYGRKNQISFVKEARRVAEMSVDDTGDEVKMLAELLPQAIISVDKSKSQAALNAQASDYDLDMLLVDDGFQHLSLDREVDIVTYDGAIKARDLKLFPYGVLREPLSSLKRVEVIIITRANFTRDIGTLRVRLKKIAPQAKIYTANFKPKEIIGHERKLPVKYLEDKAVFAFAGIGNFRTFEKQVRTLTSNLDFALEFSDHQRYTAREIDKIRDEATRYGSDLLLTTAKDWVKIRDFDFGREIYYLALEIDLDPGEEKLVKYLQSFIKPGEKLN